MGFLELAKAIAKTVAGEDLKSWEKSAIRNSEQAKQILQEIAGASDVVQKYAESGAAYQVAEQNAELAGEQMEQAQNDVSMQTNFKTAAENFQKADEKRTAAKEAFDAAQNEYENGSTAWARSIGARVVGDGVLSENSVEGYAHLFGKHAKLFTEAYEDGQDARQYTIEFAKAYNEGTKGGNLQALIDSGSLQNLSTVQINAAYQAGLDARNSLNTRRDTDGLHLRQSSIWENGANSTADVQEVEANAEQDQKRNADSGRKTAAEKAAGFTAEKAYRRVTTLEELGVKDAKAGIKVTQVSSDYSDETAKAYEMCEQNGVKCIFFTGGYLQTKDGIIARGANKDGVVYIRADDPNFTANEIAGHEIGHELVNRGSLDMDAVISEVRKEYTKEELSKIVDDYGLDFLADGVNEDELADIALEEITCDALGGMNAFASNREGNAEFIQKLQGLAEKHYTGKTGEGTFTRQKGAEQKLSAVNDALESRLSDSTRKDLEKSGLTVQDGVVVADNLAKQMREEGYEKPVDVFDIGEKFSVVTEPEWRKSFLKNGGSADVAELMRTFTENMVANDAIASIVPMGQYSKSKFGPLRANIEYMFSFDMDTSCPRTFQFINYRDRLQKMAGRPLTFNESINLMNIMKLMGQQIPCTYCYVENKRAAKSAAYLNYFAARDAVMSSKTRQEALTKMYSYDAKKGTVSAAAQKVFDQWWEDVENGSAFHPDATTAWTAWSDSRNAVFNYLDAVKESGAVNLTGAGRKTSRKALQNMALRQFGIKEKIGNSTNPAANEIINFVQEWEYDTKAGVEHKYFTENSADASVQEDMLTVHRLANNYSSSATSAKTVENYTPYVDQLKAISPELKKYIMGMGGIRKHSSNDFRIDYVQDYFLFYADLARDGWTGHTYTKSIDFCKIFGRCGDRINLSIAFDTDTENGKIIENDQEGAPHREARKIRGAYENVGVMAMVTDNAQLSYVLNSDWIDMCIPFHASGLPKAIWYNMKAWCDYTTKQLESFLTTDEMRQALIDEKVDIPAKATKDDIAKLYNSTFGIKQILSKAGTPVRPHFFPNDTIVNGQLVPGHHNNVEEYFRLCREYGVHPRFYSLQVTDKSGKLIPVTEHPGYVKLIKETSRTDTEQTPIRFNFNEFDPYLGMSPMDYAMREMEAFGKINGYETNNQDPMGIVPKFAKDYLGKDRPAGYVSPTFKRDIAVVSKLDAHHEMYDADMEAFYSFRPADNTKENEQQRGTEQKFSAVGRYDNLSEERLREIKMNWPLTWAFHNDILKSEDMIIINNEARNVFVDKTERDRYRVRRNVYAFPVTNGKTVFMSGSFANPVIDFVVEDIGNEHDILVNSLRRYASYARKNGNDKGTVPIIRRFFGTRGIVSHDRNDFSYDRWETVARSGANGSGISEGNRSRESEVTSEKQKFSTVNSEGEPLSQGQAEFFKDSKIRDEDGNLRVVYHGTDADFTVFDRTKGRSTMDIQGSFFSPWDIDAGGYGGNVTAYYLNIKNPAPEGIAYKALNRFKGQNGAGIKAREYLESLGYDGVNNSDEEYIAFRPEQIKRIDNINPTLNPDVRYSTVNSTQLALENPDVYDEIQVTFDEILQKTKGKDLEAALLEEAQKHQEDRQLWEHEAAVLTKLWKQSEKNEYKLSKALSERRDRVSEVSEELRERRRDVRTMENEFVRVVREWEKQTGKLEGKAKEAASLKQALKDSIREHRQDNAAWEREYDRLLKMYERNDRQIDRLAADIAHRKEMAAKGVEGRKRTVIRNKILDLNKDFQKILDRPEKGITAHAPRDLIKPIAEFCGMFADAEYGYRTNQLNQAIERGNSQERLDQITRAQSLLANISRRYTELSKASGLAGASYTQETAEQIAIATELISDMFDYRNIHEMNSDELTVVYNAMKSIMHSIKTANRMTAMETTRTLVETVDRFNKNIDEAIPASRMSAKYAQRYLMWQMSPHEFFQYICGYAKDNVGLDIDRMFKRGTEKMLGVQRDFDNLFNPILNQDDKEIRRMTSTKEKDLVTVGLQDRNGNEVKLTRGMRLSVYMMLSQEDGLRSIAYGGFALPRIEEYYHGNISAAYGGEDIERLYTASQGGTIYEAAKTIQSLKAELKEAQDDAQRESLRQSVSAAQERLDSLVAGEEARLIRMREDIWDSFSDYEKQLVNAANQWMEHSGNLMQETYYELNGFDPVRVNHYWPIHRDPTTIQSLDTTAVANEINLANSGFTKARVKANNPILLTDFFQELMSSKQKMSRYYGFAVAQRDFDKLYMFKYPGSDFSVKKRIMAKFQSGTYKIGVSAEQYIKNYIDSVSGANKADGSWLSDLYSRSAGATLTANARVALSQLASIPTAAAVVGWKNAAIGFSRGIGYALSKQAKDQLASDSVWFYQRYKGEGSTREIADMRNSGGLAAKAMNSGFARKYLNWCQNMDVLATGPIMWEMAKSSVLETGMQETDPGFKSAVQDKYADIIRFSQPNYTETERSDLLRDKRVGSKILTMYKTQSNQNLNILVGASLELRKMKSDFKAGKNGVTAADVKAATAKCVSAYTAVAIGNTILFPILRFIGNLIIRNMKPYKDDETGEVDAESVMGGILKDAFSSIAGTVAMGSILYDGVYAVLSGERYYGISDNAVGLLSDTLTSMVTLGQAVTSGKNVTDKAVKMLLNLAASFGIPAKNLKNLATAAYGWANQLVLGGPNVFAATDSTSTQDNARFVSAVLADKEEKAGNELAYLISKSDEPNLYLQSKDAASNVKSYLKDQFEERRISEDEATKVLRYLEYEDEDIKADIKQWKCVVETGIKYGNIGKSVMKGIITEDYAVELYMTYGGMSESKARDKVYGYVFDQTYPKLSDLSETAKLKFRTASESGISAEVFANAYRACIGGKKEDIVNYIMSIRGLTMKQRKALWDAVKGNSSDAGTPFA